MDKHYDPKTMEPELQQFWEDHGVYHFDQDNVKSIYSIDTPPPTVSGKLHLGHIYSYSHVDFMARYFRMRGHKVFYPMGFDDNGLPTEHLVERKLGKTAREMGRREFIDACLETSDEEEAVYRQLWQRLGLSIDWRYSYRTIGEDARKISQKSFLDLYEKGLVYRQIAPSIWCPKCQTAIAQADLVDIENESEFVTLRFDLENGGSIPIATTRPELLPACVAVFIHPAEDRYGDIVGNKVIVPLFGQKVPILADPQAIPEVGTGIVMCCTFGDQTDIHWWRAYDLPLIEAIDREGKMTEAAGVFAGRSVIEARKDIKSVLEKQGLLLDRKPTSQMLRAHERDDVPVEYHTSWQWFVRLLDEKQLWLELGEQLQWHPDYMKKRYISWVENLSWDWCISRQRFYGVPFPIWYCKDCGEVLLPNPERLPIDPLIDKPDGPCPTCGSMSYLPEVDVLDTWATSSLSPQIATHWNSDDDLFQSLFPMTLRPQAHEIIRTWAFYTIVKSWYHFGKLPWKDVMISGWGIAGEGMGKISKSRGGGPMPPMEMLEKYSADAVRYWAASTGTGKDAIISEEKVKVGQKLVNKLWNLARFSQKFILAPMGESQPQNLTGADRWILAKLNELINQVTLAMDHYDYALAKTEIEKFLWGFSDNYLEMAKGRLYSDDEDITEPAKFTLSKVLFSLVKLFTPFMPHVTEAIYQSLFDDPENPSSIHTSTWPEVDEEFSSPEYLELGIQIVSIASAIRRYKSEKGLSLGTIIPKLEIEVVKGKDLILLKEGLPDLKSITRANEIEIVPVIYHGMTEIHVDLDSVKIAIRES
ncbi:valine--tRNA ligase [Chloroflexota bacterium]|nr:valine--tRNA ligase [Chloroflexota bacterium]